jgi:hypothetical protein
MIDTRTTVAEGGRIAALWMGLLLAPTAFLVNLELSYLAVPESCARGTAPPLHLIHGACLLAALAGAVIAWQRWSAGAGGHPSEAGLSASRSQFLAGLGLAGSALFALTIVAQWIPTLTLHPCE